MSNMQILNIDGVECYKLDGTAYLKLETVARGRGFTQEKNGVQYVKWERVDEYLRSIKNSPQVGKRPEYIPENVFYRLAMKAKNEVAEKFQAKIADEIIPAIRKTGTYSVTPQRGLTTDDYLKAASIVSACKNERLPYVLDLLRQAGFNIAKIEPPKNSDEEFLKLLNQYSLDELCAKLDICRTSLYYYRTGKYKPSKERRKIIVSALSE